MVRPTRGVRLRRRWRSQLAKCTRLIARTTPQHLLARSTFEAGLAVLHGESGQRATRRVGAASTGCANDRRARSRGVGHRRRRRRRRAASTPAPVREKTDAATVPGDGEVRRHLGGLRARRRRHRRGHAVAGDAGEAAGRNGGVLPRGGARHRGRRRGRGRVLGRQHEAVHAPRRAVADVPGSRPRASAAPARRRRRAPAALRAVLDEHGPDDVHRPRVPGAGAPPRRRELGPLLRRAEEHPRHRVVHVRRHGLQGRDGRDARRAREPRLARLPDRGAAGPNPPSRDDGGQRFDLFRQGRPQRRRERDGGRVARRGVDSFFARATTPRSPGATAYI